MSKGLYERTLILLGENNLHKLQSAHVAIFGLGGVGSYALEAIVRAGVRTITIVDFDRIEETNINRQILATYPDIGKLKVDVAEKRILSINPEAQIHKFPLFVNSDSISEIMNTGFLFAIDAIDTVPSKIELLSTLYNKNIQTVSCMGAGMKLDPSAIVVDDISKTHTCPLAKIIRSELKKRNITQGITCVFSKEVPKQLSTQSMTVNYMTLEKPIKKQIVGSISYIPGIIGLISAGIIIQKILNN